MTVFLNGVLLHNRKELMGPTVHRALAKLRAASRRGSLVLQDHQQPVRYRNIWIRRLRQYDASRIVHAISQAVRTARFMAGPS
jgi:hypothetical protein